MRVTWSNFRPMNYRSYLSILILFICLKSIVYAGDKEVSHKAQVVIPEVAMLALQYESGSNLEFTGNTPNIAGDQFELSTVSKSPVWLNYSSVVSQNQKRKVTATVLGNIPNGVVLKIKTQGVSNQGVGELGKSKGMVRLSNSPADIISGIGSCYTGKGIRNGQGLTYEVEIDNDLFYQNEQISDLSLSVVYTLTDDN